MDLNWLSIIILIFLLLNVLIGWRKGFLKSIITVGTMMLALFLTVHSYTYLSKGIQKYTDVESTIAENIAEALEVNTQEKIDTKANQIIAIEGLEVPESIKTAIIDNNNHDIYDKLGVTDFYHYVGEYLSCIIVNASSFMIAFIIIWIVLLIVFKEIAENVKDVPIVGGLDKIGGIVIGVIKTILDVWVFFIGLTIVGNLDIGKNIFEMINRSPWLSYLYDHNLLLEVITNVSKVLF